MRKRQPPPEGQASLFGEKASRAAAEKPARPAVTTKTASTDSRTWRMPDVQGRTVAEIRLRWLKRLTPAQVARVEAEISSLPRTLTKLGFGTVEVERAFVRRRRS